MERKLIASIIHDRNSFNKIQPLALEQELSEPAKIIYSEIANFYDNDAKATSCDVDILKSAIERKYPKHYQAINSTFDRDTEVSSVNVVEEYIELRRKNLAMRLSSALLEGHKQQISPLLDSYNDLLNATTITDEEKTVSVGINLSTLGSSEEREFALYPKALQDRTKGAGRGHHILLYARPEVGKSMFSINMASMFCKKGKKVLYIGNEDPEEDMLYRFTSRLTGRNKKEILTDLDDAQLAANESGADNLVFASLSPGTIPEIRGLIEQHKPDILFVDQIRNLDVGLEGLVNILEKAATDIRNLAKRYGLLAVSVTQAGDSATDKLVLKMSDVDSSKTGLPAQVDLMVGIGCDGAFDSTNRRMLSLPKNKLGGDHSFFPVSVDPTLSKVNSI